MDTLQLNIEKKTAPVSQRQHSSQTLNQVGNHSKRKSKMASYRHSDPEGQGIKSGEFILNSYVMQM